MTRILTLVAALAACAVARASASRPAAAADKPSLADEVAAKLGVSPEQLRTAFRAALTARVDAAVAAGKLTPEQAAKLKAANRGREGPRPRRQARLREEAAGARQADRRQGEAPRRRARSTSA